LLALKDRRRPPVGETELSRPPLTKSQMALALLESRPGERLTAGQMSQRLRTRGVKLSRQEISRLRRRQDYWQQVNLLRPTITLMEEKD
jgi:hypothetical protein